MGRRKKSSPETLLTGVVATGAGSAVTADGLKNLTLQVVATNVSSGGSMGLEGTVDGTSFGLLTPKDGDQSGLAINNRLGAISSNGTFLLEYENVAVKKVRANLSARSDGTFTAKVWMAE